MRTRLLVSGTIGVLAGALTWLLMSRLNGGAGDFNWSYDAARALLSRQDPYSNTPAGVIPYPLPAALFAIPFAWLSREIAGGAFFGISSALLAFGLTKQGYLRLLVFLCYPYWAAMITVQWSPLLAASACFPLLLPLTLGKPHIGLPVALTNLSRRGILLTLGVLAISFVVMPSWLSRWLAQLGGYQHFFPLLIPPGFLLLLAVWSIPRSRRSAAIDCIRRSPTLVLRSIHSFPDSENASRTYLHDRIKLGSGSVAMES